MPRKPSPSHTRLPSDGASDPASDVEPLNPHIIARSGVRGVCRVHWCERPCNGCLAAEVDSIRIADRFTDARRDAYAVAAQAAGKAGAR